MPVMGAQDSRPHTQVPYRLGRAPSQQSAQPGSPRVWLGALGSDWGLQSQGRTAVSLARELAICSSRLHACSFLLAMA